MPWPLPWGACSRDWPPSQQFLRWLMEKNRYQQRTNNHIFHFYYLFCSTSTLIWLITASHPYQQGKRHLQKRLKTRKLKKGSNSVSFHYKYSSYLLDSYSQERWNPFLTSISWFVEAIWAQKTCIPLVLFKIHANRTQNPVSYMMTDKLSYRTKGS